MTALARRFGISDVALRKTCIKFDIPVPQRGYWAKLHSGKSTTKVTLPVRAAGMDDEVVVGGGNYHWHDQPTDEEILGPSRDRPTFSEAIESVRDRVHQILGKVVVAKAMTAQHPAIARLVAQDEARRQKQLTATYTFSWEKPVFDSPFEQRRLRLLNALFLAVARCGGRPEVRGQEAREISITVHQTRVAISLDRPPVVQRNSRGSVSQGGGGADQLRFAIVARYDRDQERVSWQDGEAGRLERFIQEIAVEVITTAEINYRESCLREFDWRVQRKAQLEEDARNHQLQVEREERERQQKREQDRIDRLLDEAASLRRAIDIRAYVAVVKTTVASGASSISSEAIERWARWVVTEADRIDPVKSARFLKNFEAEDNAN